MKRPTEYNRTLRRAALWYTLLFALTAGLVFLPYVRTGRSFVYKVDGASQYIVYLRYMGQYLRTGLRNLLHGQLTPVMYDFAIGMGDDINAIVRFHPLDFLSVFVPARPRLTEYLYACILLLRYFLAGLSFLAFALSRPVSGARVAAVNALSGALLYVFSGYMLMRVMNHPTYAAPFILLPLLLLGAERVMEGRGQALFPAAVALSFISNYYFMYICSIALAAYVLLRLPAVLGEVPGKMRGRRFAGVVVRLAGWYLLGLGLSLITLLPTLTRYFNSYRTQQISTEKSLWLYTDLRRYGAWLVNLIAPYVSSGNGTNLNFAVTAFPVLILLLIACRGSLRVLKGSLLLELACLLIPAGGYVLAAFNNENNRWMFLIALSLGMCLALLTDRLAELSQRQGILLLAAGAVYGVLALAAWRLEEGGPYYPAACGMLAVCLLVLLVLRRRSAPVRAFRGAVLVMTVLSVVGNAWLTYLPDFGNVTAQSTGRGAAFSRYTGSSVRILADLAGEDETFWRSEVSGVTSGKENIALYYGVHGTAMYNSILNAHLIGELLAEDNVGLDAVTHLQDLDTRPVSEALAGVKYYVTKREGVVPAGFSAQPVLSRDGIFVYENEQVLPFGYTYDTVLSEEVRRRLDPEAQEWALLHAAALEEQDLTAAEHLAVAKTLPAETVTVPLPFPEGGERAERTAEGYRALQKNAVLTLEVERRAGYSCMLRLRGLRGPKDLCRVVVRAGDMKKTVSLRSAGQVYTIGREDYLIDLMDAVPDEAAAADTLQVQVVLKAAGAYALGAVEAVYEPLDSLSRAVQERSEEALTDVTFAANRITGTAVLSEEKLMAFSVLYQKGWTLLVDGVKTPLYKVNGCWTGAVLEAGSHEIELRYVTPGLPAGAAASGISLLVWLLLLGMVRRRGRKEERAA